MAENVGYATLSVIPSAKGFLKKLRAETQADLKKFGEEIGKQLSEQIADAINDGLGNLEVGSLGRRVRESVEDATEEGVSEGVNKGTAPAATALRAAISRALRDGFRDGYRRSFAQSQDQGDRLRRSLVRGLAGGILGAIKGAFSAALDAGQEFVKNLNDALRKGGEVALAAIIGTIQTAAGTAATGGLNLLVGALVAVALAIPAVIAAFLGLAPIVAIVGGAFGSLFTIIAGGGASIAVIALATRGLGDAFGELAENGKISEKTLKKLAPSAANFVRQVAKLRKPFAEIQKYVQGRFFRGLGGVIGKLAKAWRTPLKAMLGDLAEDFNGTLKTLGAALGRADFIANIRKATAGFGGFLERIGRSLGPLTDAFGRLAAASVPFLAQLGDLIGGAAENFAAWIAQADKSGALKSFMESAAASLRTIWSIGGLVFKIIGDIIRILFKPSEDAGGGVLRGVEVALQKIHAWLGNPENQKKIEDFWNKLKGGVDKLVNEWLPRLGNAVLTIEGWINRIEGWGNAWDRFAGRVSGAVRAAQGAVTGASAAIRGALTRLGSPLRAVAAGFAVMAATVRARVNAVLATVRALPGRIVAVLSGLASQLFVAGQQAIAGFVRGLLSQAGAIISAGSRLGAMALAAVRNSLIIRSPSKKMAELGRWAARGFVAGMVGGFAEVKRTAETLAEKVLAALKAQGLSDSAARKRVNALMKALAPKQAQLNALAKRWDSLTEKIEAARDKLADAIRAREDFKASVRNSVIDSGSITGIDAGNSGGIIAHMRAQLAKAKKWASVLGQLRKQGLNDTTYRQLVEAGPDSLPIAETLLAGGKGAITEVNKIQADLAKVANGVGSSTSKALYQAGVDAAAGLVKGLETQRSAIERIMELIAKSMVRTLKRELKIKSPSRVLMRLGSQSGAGYAVGLERSGRRVTRAYAALTALPDVTSPGIGSSASATATGGPLIGSLTLAPSGDSVRDQLDEVTWRLRRIQRGGVYARS